ncbi:MAG: 50S ribosomal protein L10 [Deltaproteobacteria bacterium]|nr:50S ribosomal protein L10 [Deltaproteobacteria bacterium]
MVNRKKSKAESVEALRGVIAGLRGAVVAEYRGLTVAEITGLRKKLREADADFRVVKNTLVRLAAKDTPFSQLEGWFAGPTAIAVAKGDPVAMAKAMKEFAVASPKVTLKAGYLDGKVLTAKEVEALAEVPAREVLLARLAGGLAGPLSRLVQALSGSQRKLVCVLDSIHKLKTQQQTA